MNTEQEIDALFSAIDGGRILDVATGMGGMIDVMVDLLKSFDEIIGIDAANMRARLPQLSAFSWDNVHFQQMDAHIMTFTDASFDTVTISNSLHHMTDPKQVLREMWRVLKPGGRMIVMEMYRDNQTEEQLTHVQMHHWWAAIDRARKVTHDETFTRDKLVTLVETVNPRALTLHDFAELTDDPKNPETIEILKSRIDLYVERAKNLRDNQELMAQADGLRQRLDEVGFHSATALIAVAEK